MDPGAGKIKETSLRGAEEILRLCHEPVFHEEGSKALIDSLSQFSNIYTQRRHHLDLGLTKRLIRDDQWDKNQCHER